MKNENEKKPDFARIFINKSFHNVFKSWVKYKMRKHMNYWTVFAIKRKENSILYYILKFKICIAKPILCSHRLRSMSCGVIQKSNKILHLLNFVSQLNNELKFYYLFGHCDISYWLSNKISFNERMNKKLLQNIQKRTWIFL